MNLELNEPQEPKPITIVRVTTTAFRTKRGLKFVKEITYLKRKSSGHNFLEYEVEMVDAPSVQRKIANLQEIEDGVYRVILCDISKDWEMGIIDDYRFKLIQP